MAIILTADALWRRGLRLLSIAEFRLFSKSIIKIRLLKDLSMPAPRLLAAAAE